MENLKKTFISKKALGNLVFIVLTYVVLNLLISNGILNPFTVIFYPISPKLLLVSPEQVMEGNDYFDGGIYFLNTDDVRKINKKQFEQCYRHVYSHSQEILEKL